MVVFSLCGSSSFPGVGPCFFGCTAEGDIFVATVVTVTVVAVVLLVSSGMWMPPSLSSPACPLGSISEQ